MYNLQVYELYKMQGAKVCVYKGINHHISNIALAGFFCCYYC